MIDAASVGSGCREGDRERGDITDHVPCVREERERVGEEPGDRFDEEEAAVEHERPGERALGGVLGVRS